MTCPDKCRLLFEPYVPPALQRGDQATCLFRDCDVVITGWSDGRIPWPRCRALGTHGGGSGLLVEAELARAVRGESAAAIKHWWGASNKAVWHWRQALGVGRMDSEGSRRLILAAANLGGEANSQREFSGAEREQRRRRAIELELGKYLQPGYRGPRWTRKELQLLGHLPDDQVAARVGRTTNAVRVMRNRLGIETAVDLRRR